MMSHQRQQHHRQLLLLQGLLLLLFQHNVLAFTSISTAAGRPSFVGQRRQQQQLPLQVALTTTTSSSWNSRNGTGLLHEAPILLAAGWGSHDVRHHHNNNNLESTSSSSNPAALQNNNYSNNKHRRRHQNKFRLYCDLDGVLVDFEAGIRRVFPNLQQQHHHHEGDDDNNVGSFHIANLDRRTMWETIERQGQFFEQLPWTASGKVLWQSIAHLEPSILTGVPPYRQARLEKVNWCKRELVAIAAATTSTSSSSSSMTGTSGQQQEEQDIVVAAGCVVVHHVDMAGHADLHIPVNGNTQQQGVLNVITCWSNNKHHESHPNAILIDDREFLRHDWERKGGIFVHHKGNAEETIQRLREIGVPLLDHNIICVEQDNDDDDPFLP